MKLTIERDKWLRGEGSDESCLLRTTDQKMCCLGFLACKLGYSEQDIANLESPVQVISETQKNLWPAEMMRSTFYPNENSNILPDDHLNGVPIGNGNVTMNLMLENDLEIDEKHSRHSEADRERKLKEIFASIGIEVEFV